MIECRLQIAIGTSNLETTVLILFMRPQILTLIGYGLRISLAKEVEGQMSNWFVLEEGSTNGLGAVFSRLWEVVNRIVADGQGGVRDQSKLACH